MAARLSPGTLFAGRFRVERELAAGGMGVLYVVVQEATNQRCALKVLNIDALYDDEARARFEAEARNTPSDLSEHVVRVLDAGVHEGIPWLLLELLDGGTLHAWVTERGPFSPQEFLTVFQQLCHGLAAAHARGIVHRDLKPENLFLHQRRDVAGGLALKILDFGIAKSLGRRHEGAASIVAGTPGWASPEQLGGAAGISAATDVWALGLLAFYCLTGRRYQEFGSPMPGMSPSASQRALAMGVASRIPAGFDPWFACCVQFDPRHRYPDANLAMVALTGALAPPKTPPPPPAASRPPTADQAPTSPPRWLRWVPAFGGLVLVGSLTLAWRGCSTGADRVEDTPSPSDSAARNLTALDPALRPFLDGWVAAIHRPRVNATQLSPWYNPRLHFHTWSTAGLQTVASYWQTQLAPDGNRATFEIDWDRTVQALETVNDSHRDCASMTDADPGVTSVWLWARETEPGRPTRTRGRLPCETVEGPYVLRLRTVVGRPRICWEGWTLCDAVCRSCPETPDCARRCPR